MPFLPDSLLGSNWSAPKARLQGRMPPAPMTKNPNPVNRKANCQEVGPVHVPVPDVEHVGGCSLEIAADRVKTAIPL